MLTIAAYAIQFANLLKAAIDAGKSIKEIYDIIKRTEANLQKMESENRGPNDAEWDALNAETETLRAKLPEITEGE